jgi:uncharacterized protein YheU (UPF0270 family)
MSTDEVIDVPFAALEPDTLRRLIEEFVTRDTTDYGERERTLESKVADVMLQLRRGEVRIVVDRETNTVNIVPVGDRADGT